jgi:hypothetical protein
VITGEETRRLTLVSALYTALTFVMAYPLSASPGSMVVDDAPDTRVYLWTLAWDAYAFLHQPLRIFDANIYYPFSNTLAYSENLIGTAFLSAPVAWLTGNHVLAMNLAALLTCVLCGVGGYFLARRWSLSPYAAFLCGLVFEFAPPRFFKLGQLHLTAVQWIPFTLAFLHSYLEHGKRKDLLLALGCFSLQVLSSGHGALFLVLAIALMLAWRITFGQPIAIRQWLRDCGATGAYLLAPSVWVMLPYRSAQVEGGLRRGYAADAMPGIYDFFASPSHLHIYLQRAWFGKPINDAALAFMFPGILALLLGAVALLTWRRGRWRADATAYFAVLGALSTLMFATWPFDLWRHIYWMPGFNFIRVPPRFVLLGMLCLSMLVAIGFDRLTSQLSSRARLIAAIAVSVALLGEYISVPFAAEPYVVNPPAIDRWLNTRPKPFAIAEFPQPSPGNIGAYERHHTQSMMHSTAHWQKTVHGYSSLRRPLHDRMYLEMTTFPDDAILAELQELGVTYVVVHTEQYPGERWKEEIAPRVAKSRRLELLHTDGAGRVYALRKP